MKGLFHIHLGLLLILFASCVKEEAEPQSGKTLLDFSVEKAQTKVAPGNNDGTYISLLWEAGDKIDVNGRKSHALETGGSGNASFAFDGAISSPYKAVYPAAAVASVGNTLADLILPAAQNSTDGKFDRDACLLIGTGSNNSVSMTHAMAYISFIFERGSVDAVLSSLEITAAGGEKLSGGFTTDYTTLSPKGDASSSVTVNCNATVGSGMAITVAIPACNYEHGFNIVVRDTEGRTMSKTAAGSFNAAAGHFYTTTLAYQPDVDYPEYLYIAGDAVEWEWNPEDPRAAILEVENGIYRADITFDFGENGGKGFKFWETSTWGTEYGMTTDSEFGNIGIDLRSTIGGDPQFYLGQKGYQSGDYTLIVNLNTKKVTLFPAGMPETLYMSGGFNGWSPVQMEKIGEGKFRVEDYEFDFFSSEEDVKGHGIKFFESTEDGWPGQWGPKENYETQNYRGWELASYGDAPQFYPLLAGFESGTYTVLVDFTTMTISLTPVEPEYPTSIRIYGPTFAWEWNNEAARCIINGENGIFEFSAAMYLDEDWKGFKFVDNTGGTPDWENKEYGMRADATADNIGFDLVKTIGGDPQFYLNPLGYESAIYTVRIDFTTMKLSLTRTHDIQEPFYVFGEGLDNDWATVDALALNEVEHNVFEGYDIHLYKTSSFKIVSNRESWVEYRRDVNAGDYWTLISDKDEPNDTRFIPGEADQNFKNGKYTVSVNLNTMKASLTLTEADAGEYPLSLYILGPAAVDAGWNLGNFIPMTMVSPGIFQAENVNISVGAAVDGDNKGNGFKFGISNTSWSTEYGAKEAFDDQDGTTGYRGWELAQNSNQFYPLLMGLTDGYYTITADFNTMTVSMTKE